MKTFFKILIITLFWPQNLFSQQNYSGTVTDISANVYPTIIIGKYIWIAENLKTNKFNDGTEISKIEGNTLWSGLDFPAYCWYNDNPNNSIPFGALYNWFAINSGKLCPIGWRVPSDLEWKYLEGYSDSLYKVGNPIWDKSGLRGINAGKKLKSRSGWRFGGNGTNNFGFSALPGGERLMGFHNTISSSGFWWTSTEADSSNAWYRCIIYSLDEISRDIHPKRMGFSVRCIKDNQ
jgi:uncharacterized protein (TIGR02145 family)